MKIDQLIDRNYTSISILEDMYEVSEWLKELDYLCVVDEELKIKGIITLKDVHINTCSSVLDCNFKKPFVDIEESIFDVYRLMVEAKTDYLPVTHQNKFAGVISLRNITDILVDRVGDNYSTF